VKIGLSLNLGTERHKAGSEEERRCGEKVNIKLCPVSCGGGGGRGEERMKGERKERRKGEEEGRERWGGGREGL
jgi:hypothetical protein